MKDGKQDAITNKEEEESNTCPLTSASMVVTWAAREKSVTIPGKKYPKSGSNHTKSPFEGKKGIDAGDNECVVSFMMNAMRD